MGRMRDCGKVFGFHSLFFICKENERNVKKKQKNPENLVL